MKLKEIASLVLFGVIALMAFIINDAHAQKTHEQRRLEEYAKNLKSSAATHCDQYSGQVKTDCQSIFATELKADLIRQAKRMIQDVKNQAENKVNAQIDEEDKILKFTKLLDAVGVGHSECSTSACLKLKYEVYVAEQEAIKAAGSGSGSGSGSGN